VENLLTPDFGLTIWTTVVFLILVAVLGKFAWKPMIQALEDRENGIRKSIDDAAAAQKAAESLKAQLEAELASAHQKAQSLLQDARQEAGSLRDQLMKQADADSRKLVDQTRAQLEEEKQKLTRELRQEVGALSVRVAEKLLRHSMNESEQQKLVQSLLADVEKDSRKN